MSAPAVADRQREQPATDALMMEVAGRLREVRGRFRKEGVGLRPWAQLLEGFGYPVHWTSVQRYETGQLAIPASYVLIVARAARVSPLWLLTGTGERRWVPAAG